MGPARHLVIGLAVTALLTAGCGNDTLEADGEHGHDAGVDGTDRGGSSEQRSNDTDARIPPGAVEIAFSDIEEFASRNPPPGFEEPSAVWYRIDYDDGETVTYLAVPDQPPEVLWPIAITFGDCAVPEKTHPQQFYDWAWDCPTVAG